MTTPDSLQPIDIEKEACRRWVDKKTTIGDWSDWARSIAARVEESTIERVVALTLKMDAAITDADIVPRIYAPAALGKGETK